MTLSQSTRLHEYDSCMDPIHASLDSGENIPDSVQKQLRSSKKNRKQLHYSKKNKSKANDFWYSINYESLQIRVLINPAVSKI